MKPIIMSIGMVVATASLILAQGRPGQGVHAGSGLNMSQVRTISGPVASVNIAFGMRYPCVTIGTTSINMAPPWYLLDKNLVIKTGDWLSVLAAPSNSASDSALYAVEISNTTTGTRIALRDTNGLPLWSGGNALGSVGAGYGTISGEVKTTSGTIENLRMGLGIPMPSVTVKDAGGQLLTIRLGPERVLLASSIELRVGDRITVRYALASGCGNLVALSVTDSAGTTVNLRNTSVGQ